MASEGGASFWGGGLFSQKKRKQDIDGPSPSPLSPDAVLQLQVDKESDGPILDKSKISHDVFGGIFRSKEDAAAPDHPTPIPEHPEGESDASSEDINAFMGGKRWEEEEEEPDVVDEPPDPVVPPVLATSTHMDERSLDVERMDVALRWLKGCRNVEACYENLNTIDEGTYGKVFRARNRESNEIVALKKVKMFEKWIQHDGFPITALREINLMLQLRHENIVNVQEVVMADLESIYMVMEFADHDIRSIMDVMSSPFRTGEVKCLLLQLLKGLDYLHHHWVVHRDIKPSNLLLTGGGILKLCDFGMARQYGEPLKPYTPYDKVVTLWYRAPELLMGAALYAAPVDMWSVGCIFAELLRKEPLFPGEGEVVQWKRITHVLGAPNEQSWPGFDALPNPYRINFKMVTQRRDLREMFPKMSFSGGITLSDSGFDLLSRMLAYDPAQRITAGEALSHPYFSEAPLPCDPAHMPTLESTHVEHHKRPKKHEDNKEILLRMLEEDAERHKRAGANDRHYELKKRKL